VKYGVNIVDRSPFSGVTRVQCGILWRVSDCEELVGRNRPRSTIWCMTIQYYNINYNQAPKNTNGTGLP